MGKPCCCCSCCHWAPSLLVRTCLHWPSFVLGVPSTTATPTHSCTCCCCWHWCCSHWGCAYRPLPSAFVCPTSLHLLVSVMHLCPHLYPSPHSLIRACLPSLGWAWFALAHAHACSLIPTHSLIPAQLHLLLLSPLPLLVPLSLALLPLLPHPHGPPLVCVSNTLLVHPL